MRWSDIKKKIAKDWEKARARVVNVYNGQNSNIKSLGPENLFGKNIREYAFMDILNAYGVSQRKFYLTKIKPNDPSDDAAYIYKDTQGQIKYFVDGKEHDLVLKNDKVNELLKTLLDKLDNPNCTNKVWKIKNSGLIKAIKKTTNDITPPIITKYPAKLRWRLLCNKQGEFDRWTPLRFIGNLGRLIFMYPARFLDFKCRQIMLDESNSAFTRGVFLGLHRVFQGIFLQMRAIFAAGENVKRAWDIHPVMGVLAFVWSVGSCLLISPVVTAAVLFVAPVLTLTGLSVLLGYIPWGPIGNTASNALQVAAQSMRNAFDNAHDFVTAFIGKHTEQAVVTNMEAPSAKIPDNDIHKNFVGVIGGYVNALKATFVTAKKTYGTIKNWLFGEKKAENSVIPQNTGTSIQISNVYAYAPLNNPETRPRQSSVESNSDNIWKISQTPSISSRQHSLSNNLPFLSFFSNSEEGNVVSALGRSLSADSNYNMK